MVKILFVYEEGTLLACNAKGTLTNGCVPIKVNELPVLINTSKLKGPVFNAVTVNVFGGLPINVENSPNELGEIPICTSL